MAAAGQVVRPPEQGDCDLGFFLSKDVTAIMMKMPAPSHS
eukprot:COSAG06_NODE_46611_length_345_cov_1.264228_1_plen_39_part_10